MIPDADRMPADTGYVLTLYSGARLHIWPETGLVVSERFGEPLGAGVSVAASGPSVTRTRGSWHPSGSTCSCGGGLADGALDGRDRRAGTVLGVAV